MAWLDLTRHHLIICEFLFSIQVMKVQSDGLLLGAIGQTVCRRNEETSSSITILRQHVTSCSRVPTVIPPYRVYLLRTVPQVYSYFKVRDRRQRLSSSCFFWFATLYLLPTYATWRAQVLSVVLAIKHGFIHSGYWTAPTNERTEIRGTRMFIPPPPQNALKRGVCKVLREAFGIDCSQSALLIVLPSSFCDHTRMPSFYISTSSSRQRHAHLPLTSAAITLATLLLLCINYYLHMVIIFFASSCSEFHSIPFPYIGDKRRVKYDVFAPSTDHKANL